jgi:3-oxoacyl-[acyl-carrier protein] reductase
VAPTLAKQAEALGGVDILVSNAGLRRQTSFLDMSFEEWREIMSVALDGAFLLGKAFVPQMVAKGQGGAFVAMSACRPMSAHSTAATYRRRSRASKG